MERDSEKGQHRRRRRRLEGDYSRQGTLVRGKEEKRKKERDGEKAPDLIYRRGVSVIISLSLSRPTLGSELLSCAPSSSPLPHPFYLHPSGYRDCGRARSHLSARIGPARSGAPLNDRVVFQLCRRVSFTIPLLSLLLFPRTSRGIPENGGGFIRERYIRSVTTTTSAIFQFSFAAFRDRNLGDPRSFLSLSLSLFLSLSRWKSSSGSKRRVSRRH